MQSISLKGKVALVTGASRGIGRGVALGLGEAGATVYVTGRTVAPQSGPEGLPGDIHTTAARVSEMGGRGVAIPCDHRSDEQVEELFRRLGDKQDRLDILVNCAWGGYEAMVDHTGYTWEDPFWEQPLWRWDAMFGAGLRAAYSASRLAARIMVRQGRGLIVNPSYWAGRKYMANAAYGTVKAATDRLTADMARELASSGVSVVSLYPGLVRTERVLRAVEFGAPLDLENSESPLFIGRAVAALAADPNLAFRTGQVLVAADLSREYGFTDEDGRIPRPLTLEAA